MSDKPLVIVYWDDIVVVNGWHDVEALTQDKVSPVRSVGWIIYEDEGRLTLAHGLSEAQGNPTTVIPKGCITKISRITCPSIYDVTLPA